MFFFVTGTQVTNKCLAVYQVKLTQRKIKMKYSEINFTLPRRSVKSIKLLLCRGCPALYSSVAFFLPNVLPVLNFSATKIDLRCSALFPFFFRRREKKVFFYNQSFFVISPIKSIPFLKFSRDHLRSTLGIACGRGLFAVHFGDHLRSRDLLRSRSGSFAVGDHLRYCHLRKQSKKGYNTMGKIVIEGNS